MNTKLSHRQLAERLARDIPANSYVNLGIGMPTLVSNYLTSNQGITLHTENGMLGMGPSVENENADWDLLNAGKFPVSELPGASFFHHADSFGMMRGGHIDLCVLGAYQVSTHGDLANWNTGDPESIPGVGGAMDLAIGARNAWTMMTLFNREGQPKMVPELTYPVTASGCISRVYSDVAVLEVRTEGVAALDIFGAYDVTSLSDALGIDLLDDTPRLAVPSEG